MTDDHTAQLAELSQYPHALRDVDFSATYDTVARPITDVDSANCISSEIVDGEHAGKHTVMLDLDVPARLIESTTPGHSHLYIDVPMAWLNYAMLLQALTDAGVIEHGYNAVSQKREHTSLRLPWIKKEAKAALEVTL